ncbi:TIGR00266 family protein [Dielma fastidiosa]|uniref:TIGR00266 family protein n=1 Tax=Dielma fastidiosa TaxID=1034346 RepID=A0AB35UPC0_9FIRM|nr:TIGR00266 family protein [Dielma fastidiosa]MDY5166974.1 TIGR00266 family protein [Dielma fastidiosa]
MKYEIIGNQLPAVELTLGKDESVYTESGGMSWMDECFEMNSNTRGGLMKGLARAFSGESIFMTTYTCLKEGGKITFGSSFPGNILPVQLSEGESLIIQKTAFLAAEESVSLEVFVNKRAGAGFFGGEGFILQKISGPGTAFLEIDGEVMEKTLKPGEKLKVDQGYIAAYEPSVDFSVETVKGVKNVLFSGEGLSLATLTGPGKVWLQTMPFNVLAGRIAACMPTKK